MFGPGVSTISNAIPANTRRSDKGIMKLIFVWKRVREGKASNSGRLHLYGNYTGEHGRKPAPPDQAAAGGKTFFCAGNRRCVHVPLMSARSAATRLG